MCDHRPRAGYLHEEPHYKPESQMLWSLLLGHTLNLPKMRTPRVISSPPFFANAAATAPHLARSAFVFATLFTITSAWNRKSYTVNPLYLVNNAKLKGR